MVVRKKKQAISRKRVKPQAPALLKKHHKIRSVSTDGHLKRITLDLPKGHTVPIHLQRFAMVGKGDTLVLQNGIQRRMWVPSESGHELIPLVPIFESFGSYLLASETVETRVAELSTSQELTDFETLEAFHYRGIDFTEIGEGQRDLPKKGKPRFARPPPLLYPQPPVYSRHDSVRHSRALPRASGVETGGCRQFRL
jgi:hypothetical protein